MFKFYLGGTELTDQPIGWDEFVLNIQFSQEERTLFIDYPNSLTFWGQGYKLIRDQRNIEICALLPFDVDKLCDNGYERVFSGLLNVTAVKFNRTKCTAEIQIEDNNIAARIRNNWEIKVNFSASVSKNNIPIGRPAAFALDVFNPRSSPDLDYQSTDPGQFFRGGFRTSYDVGAALEYLIRFVSDDILSFRSDWYDALPNDEKLCLVSGRELRYGSFLPTEDTSTFPEIGLKSVFEAVAKAFNLVMFVEGSVVRLETIESIRNTTDVFTLENLKNIEEFFDQESLYSRVFFGNKEFDRDGLHSEFISFLTHNEEEYHFTGECNIGSELDLKISNIITDTNAIERALIDGAGGVPDTLDRKYDDDTFIIVYTTVSGSAKAFNIIDFDSDGPFQYNRTLMNDAISSRYNLQADIARTIENVILANIAFEAVSTDGDVYEPVDPGISTLPRNVVITDVFLFDDDFSLGNDVGTQYGVSTPQGNFVPRASCKYTALEEGDYVFEYSTEIHIKGFSHQTNEDSLKISLVREDNFGSEITRQEQLFENIHTAPLFFGLALVDTTTLTVIGDTFNMHLNAGDRVYIEFELTVRSILSFSGHEWPLREYTFLPASNFLSLSTPSKTFKFATFDSDEYDFVMYRFDKGLSNSQVQDLIASPTSRISANDELGTISGFADSIHINMATGQSTFSIRSRENLISL